MVAGSTDNCSLPNLTWQVGPGPGHKVGVDRLLFRVYFGGEHTIKSDAVYFLNCLYYNDHFTDDSSSPTTREIKLGLEGWAS